MSDNAETREALRYAASRCPATATAYLGFPAGGQRIPCGGVEGHRGAHGYSITWVDDPIATDAGACIHGYVESTVGALVCPQCAARATTLAALPPVAGPEVRPDETLRAAVEALCDEADRVGDIVRLRDLRAALAAAPAPAPADEAEIDACPNCITPWKCNGPHLPAPAATEVGEA